MRGEENGVMLVKGDKIPAIRWTSSGDLTYLKVVKRVDLKCYHHRKNGDYVRDGGVD